MTASLNEDLPSYPYQALAAPSMATDFFGKHRCSITDWNHVEEMSHTQPQQDMVDFLKESQDAITSFYATQASACRFTAQSMTDTIDDGYVAE